MNREPCSLHRFPCLRRPNDRMTKPVEASGSVSSGSFDWLLFIIFSCVVPGLPDIELEGLEATAYRAAPRALSPRALLAHEDIDARLAQPADALGACIRLTQHRDALTCRAVNLRVLRRVVVTGGRVGQAAGVHVKDLSALTAFDRWEGFRGLLGVRGRSQGLL